MDKYEISLWEDFPDTTSSGVSFLNERKLCVIGSDSMASQARAVEPKMVTNINGTHTFTFKMYYTYIDEFTGEKYVNPFKNLLINERKVKVLWKGDWYDLLIKNLNEDTQSNSITYTCKDSYITELSRNGYNLEYSTDLQNNTGTAGELTESVLKNSGWKYDAERSTRVIQKTEEPVYEVKTLTSFNATKQSPDGDTTEVIPANKEILVFYSSIVDITKDSQEVEIQFLYAPEGYKTDENDMLVLNGNCYSLTTVARKRVGYVSCEVDGLQVLMINTIEGVSTRYRAERLVKSQRTEYDDLFDRYVNVYLDSETNKKVYSYSYTQFTDPLTVVNLIANPSNFTGLEGWIGDDLKWKLYPEFTRGTNVENYTAKSYLRLPCNKTVYNSGISANQQYLTPSQGEIKKGDIGGFHVGDKYVFRIKARLDQRGNPGTAFDGGRGVKSRITIDITKHNSSYVKIPGSPNYFEVASTFGTQNGEWVEYDLTCIKSCPANEITSLGIFLYVTSVYDLWIEEVQFFKYALGTTSYGEDAEVKRMEPGQVSLQSIAQEVYRYYNIDHDGVTDPESLSFLYEGTAPSDRFVPVTNNYEKLATIEARNSNRFNILQSIAENFKCWVRFIIDHDETGKVTLDENGLPNKYVTLVEYVGKDLGWSFEYGIDVRGIKRSIVSDNITTKILVLPNDNQFGKNGFCAIARSNLNYTKENFILDFGYYISQGLLDQDMLNRDLYSSSNNYLGYYYFLHSYNKEYDEITETLLQKRTELVKQKSQLEVLQAQQKATFEQLGNCQSDLMTLACVSTWDEAKKYISTHGDHTKVQTLMNSITRLKDTVSKNNSNISKLTQSISKLEKYIQEREARQKLIIDFTEDLHTKFFQKYARYIQEGTWQDNSYIDDNKYYLDAIDVAYTSSRPQLQYDISVIRLSSLEDFSSKTFNVGDICYVIDRDYFGYTADGITPYKLKILISEITSFFDTPEKDVIKVQNYKTQFDDLFQRITATTQSLQYAQGGYARAAAMINPDSTLSFDLLQDTFDNNENWVLNANNQQVTWDSTGITIVDSANAALKTRIMAGGIFISNDGGNTWKNAVRGDGISTNLLTAGRVNTSEIYVYDGNHPSFRWDSAGINAYSSDVIGANGGFSRFVRFDQFGLYGYDGKEDFVPSDEDTIWDPKKGVKFGLTWKGFFLRGATTDASLEISDDGDGIVFRLTSGTEVSKQDADTPIPVSLEISTEKDIVLKTGDIDRIQIGRYSQNGAIADYGIWVRDELGNNIFNVSATGTDSIGGWNLTKDSFYHTVSNSGTIGLFSEGKEWTILGPNSTQNDLNKIGNPQEGSGQPENGDKHTYYIIAGNKFGVTVDGEIYSAGGRIGGWNITRDSLYSNGDASYTELEQDSSGTGYVLPKRFDMSMQTESISNINSIKYNIHNYGISGETVLFFSSTRNYNKTTYPTVLIITDANNQILAKLDNAKLETFSRNNITIPINSEYLYLNYSSGAKLEYREVIHPDQNSSEETTEERYIIIPPAENPFSNTYYTYIDPNSTEIEIINNSDSYYKKYNVSNYKNKMLYITSVNSFATYPILAVQVEESSNGQQIKYIDSTLIDSSPVLRKQILINKNTTHIYLNSANSEGKIEEGTTRTIQINSDGSIDCIDNWSIKSDGSAYFNNIDANGGYIAGWHIDEDKIWNDSGTTLSASGNAEYNVNKYTLVTNSIAASGGYIGGWGIGYDLSSNGMTLDPVTPAIRFNNGTASIQGYDNAIGLLGWQGVYVEGPLNAGSVRTRGSFSFNSGGTFSSGDLTYLHWLYSNWGEVTPNEEWVAGLDTAKFVWNEKVTSSNYIESTNKYNITISGTIKGTDKNGVEISTEKYPTATYTIDASEAYDAGRAAGSGGQRYFDVYIKSISTSNFQNFVNFKIIDSNGKEEEHTVKIGERAYGIGVPFK